MDDFQILAKEFTQESLPLVDDIETQLLLLEEDGMEDDERAQALRPVLGALHTLKGNAGMMGYGAIMELAHHTEDAVNASANNGCVLDGKFFKAMLQVVDALRVMIGSAQENTPAPEGTLAGLESLKAASYVMVPADGTGVSVRDEKSLPPEPATSNLHIDNYTQKYLGQIGETIRVDFSKLDNILNLMGELMIYQNGLQEFGKKLTDKYPNDSGIADLAYFSERFNLTISQLQDRALEVRMLPVSQVFNRYPRFVRDLSKALGKEVDLLIQGQETEIDKSIVDAVGEPLLHMIRNAMDHGIEGPDERIKAGKPRRGQICLDARHEGAQIIVTVQDDGRGLDYEAIAQKAQALGLYREGMGRHDLEELLFVSEFSTRDSATELSGRGVGMDVVRRTIMRLGGTVSIESLPGKGTAIHLYLPLTLAIIKALRLQLGSEQYAIPISDVVESTRIHVSEIHQINQRDVVKWRDRMIYLLNLREYFELPPTDLEQLYLMVVHHKGRYQAFCVDQILGQQDVVVKSLDEQLFKPRGVSGATIMGDGRVVLILDVPALFALGKGGDGAYGLPAGPEALKERTVNPELR